MKGMIMSKTNFFGLSILLLWSGCNFPSPPNESTSAVLIGKVLYVLSAYPHHYQAGIGTKVELYQDDRSIAATPIVTENGTFQLNNVPIGIYDIVCTTSERFLPLKIANYKIVKGVNNLRDPIFMFRYSTQDSIHVTVRFKEKVSDEGIQKLILESGCEPIARYSSLLTGVVLYVLKIPNSKAQLEILEWFLKKSMVEFATVGMITPIEG
jgi:hypothetical protein